MHRVCADDQCNRLTPLHNEIVKAGLGDLPIYEALLERDIRRNETMPELHGTLVLELILQADAPFEGKRVLELGLPPAAFWSHSNVVYTNTCQPQKRVWRRRIGLPRSSHPKQPQQCPCSATRAQLPTRPSKCVGNPRASDAIPTGDRPEPGPSLNSEPYVAGDRLSHRSML
jgi:hypothetical protein